MIVLKMRTNQISQKMIKRKDQDARRKTKILKKVSSYGCRIEKEKYQEHVRVFFKRKNILKTFK